MSSDKKNEPESVLGCQERSICFPSDHSMGELWIHDKANQPLEDLYPEQGQYSQKIGEAIGLVVPPENESLNLTVSADTSTNLSPLDGLKPTDLQGIYLDNTQVTDAELVHLKGLTSLQELNLCNTQISDVGLVHLQQLPSLLHLGLSGTRISDAGLAHLKGLTSLRSLGLCNTQISDAGLVHLQRLTSLQELYIDDCVRITNTGLAYLKRLTSLKKLDLHGTQVSDVGLAHLQGLTSLRLLGLFGLLVSDIGLAYLKELASLERLVLDFTQVSDNGLIYLKELKKLQILELLGTQISDVGLKNLQGLNSLRELDLNGCGRVSDAGLVYLKELTSLQTLDIGGTQVSNAGMDYLRKFLPDAEIRTLNIFSREEIQERLIYTRFMSQANVEWQEKTLEEFRTHNPYLAYNLRSLKICQKCFRFYGLIKLVDGQMVEQKCACYWPLKEDKWQIKLPSKNYYNDFNEEYEICYCCGLEIIPSGSRWSSYYCRDCQSRIKVLNDMVGECIIPYGRHSMMNGVSLNGKDANNREAIDSFVAAVNRTNQNIDLVEKHRKVVAEKQFAMLQLTNDAPAIDLLLKSNILELWQMKTGAFFDLLATRTNLPIDRVKSLYEGLMG